MLFCPWEMPALMSVVTSVDKQQEDESESNPAIGHPRRRYRYFPGWTMLAISGAGQFMSAPGQSYSVAAIKDPMRAGLDISETDFALAYGCATLLSAALLPFFGRQIDRFGARIMLPLIAAALGGACFQMSRTETLVDLYIGFCFVRSLGQGALSLVSVWLIGEWFERNRGIATAVAGLGGGLSVMTIPVLNNLLISHFGWQTTWCVLAVAVWVVLVLPGILLIRDRPEDLGLHPDGLEPADDRPEAIPTSESAATVDSDEPRMNDVVSDAQHGPKITAFEDSWTVREVVRDPTFWKLLSVPTTAGLVGTGLIFHQVALLGRHGLTSLEALGLMTVQAGFATLMTFPIGYATDRIASRYILFVAMFVLSAATLLALTMPTTWLAIVYALLLGLHGSIMRSTANVVWINYYGRAHQGAVRGVAWAMMILGSALGPFPLALSIDRIGSYDPALYAFVVLPLLAAAAVWSARPPSRFGSVRT